MKIGRTMLAGAMLAIAVVPAIAQGVALTNAQAAAAASAATDPNAFASALRGASPALTTAIVRAAVLANPAATISIVATASSAVPQGAAAAVAMSALAALPAGQCAGLAPTVVAVAASSAGLSITRLAQPVVAVPCVGNIDALQAAAASVNVAAVLAAQPFATAATQGADAVPNAAVSTPTGENPSTANASPT